MLTCHVALLVAAGSDPDHTLALATSRVWHAPYLLARPLLAGSVVATLHFHLQGVLLPPYLSPGGIEQP